jgi:hypothetical protein
MVGLLQRIQLAGLAGLLWPQEPAQFRVASKWRHKQRESECSLRTSTFMTAAALQAATWHSVLQGHSYAAALQAATWHSVLKGHNYCSCATGCHLTLSTARPQLYSCVTGCLLTLSTARPQLYSSTPWRRGCTDPSARDWGEWLARCPSVPIGWKAVWAPVPAWSIWRRAHSWSYRYLNSDHLVARPVVGVIT